MRTSANNPLTSSLGLNILPHSSSSTQNKKTSRSFSPHVCSSSSFPRSIFNGFLRPFFSLPQFFAFSLLFLLLFPNIAGALAVAPVLCAPASVARAMASDFHANVNVAANVVSGTLTACGSTPLAVWALPKRRGNAGSDSERPSYLDTFLEVRWVYVFAPSLSHPVRDTCPTVPPRARARVCLPSLLSLSFLLPLVLHLFPLRLRVRLLLPFVFSSSSFGISFLFLFFSTSASSSRVFSSSSSSYPLSPPVLRQLIHVFCSSQSMLAQAALASGSVVGRGGRWSSNKGLVLERRVVL